MMLAVTRSTGSSMPSRRLALQLHQAGVDAVKLQVMPYFRQNRRVEVSSLHPLRPHFNSMAGCPTRADIRGSGARQVSFQGESTIWC